MPILLIDYLSGAALGTQDTVINRRKKNPCLYVAYNQEGAYSLVFTLSLPLIDNISATTSYKNRTL